MNRRNFIKLLGASGTVLLTNINVVLSDNDEDFIKDFDISNAHTIEEWKRFFSLTLNDKSNSLYISTKDTITHLNEKFNTSDANIYYDMGEGSMNKQLDSITKNGTNLVYFLTSTLISESESPAYVYDKQAHYSNGSIPVIELRIEKQPILVKGI